MFERFRHRLLAFFDDPKSRRGSIALSSMLGIALVVIIGLFVFFELNVPKASADDVQTSVTVLNTPPVWTVYARESPESSTTTPTNSGSVVTFIGTATDSNADNYFLLICKTSGVPTAFSNGPPQCNGGTANHWARSATTSSGAQATAATTTIETFPFENELNDWYAWICDANLSLPRCNAAYSQGSEPGNGFGHATSPFVVNHPPVFSNISNDTPANPGETVTWTATANDNDVQGGADTVRLFVCKANDFNGTSCGAGGGWATSTFAASNPATTTTIAIPTQDQNYAAYVYVIDNHGRTATSTFHATNSPFYINNVAPSVTASTISLEDTDGIGDIMLTMPSATSGPFRVEFEVTDNNSCLNASSTNEFYSAGANIYRSGVASTSCYASGHFNSNSCYASSSPYFSQFLTCSQDAGTCSGSSDSSANWTCTFSLWYNADPTDDGATSTPWSAQEWLATVEAYDDDIATSSFIEAVTGNDVGSFLAFDVTDTAIPYSSLEPGQQNDPLASTTDLIAVGNVGLDENLYGDTMCTTWTTADSCDTNGINSANDIPVGNQKFATSSVAYVSSLSYTLTSSTSPTELKIRVPKTTATTSPQTRDTYWGIAIPIAITLAGNYTGQNTIIAKMSEVAFW